MKPHRPFQVFMFLACIATLFSCKQESENTAVAQYHAIGNLTYLRTLKISKNAKPVAIYRHYQIDFEHNPLTTWEIVFDTDSRTQVLANDGETFFATKQHRNIYDSWIKEQEKLWEGPLPTNGHVALDPRYSQYLRNLHTTWINGEHKSSPKAEESSQQLHEATQVTSTIQKLFQWNNTQWRFSSDNFAGTKTCAIGIGEAALARRAPERRTAIFQNLQETMWEGEVPLGDWESDPRYPTYLQNLSSSGAIVHMPPPRKLYNEEDE